MQIQTLVELHRPNLFCLLQELLQSLSCLHEGLVSRIWRLNTSPSFDGEPSTKSMAQRVIAVNKIRTEETFIL